MIPFTWSPMLFFLKHVFFSQVVLRLTLDRVGRPKVFSLKPRHALLESHGDFTACS